jgi:hypothetical protein
VGLDRRDDLGQRVAVVKGWRAAAARATVLFQHATGEVQWPHEELAEFIVAGGLRAMSRMTRPVNAQRLPGALELISMGANAGAGSAPVCRRRLEGFMASVLVATARLYWMRAAPACQRRALERQLVLEELLPAEGLTRLTRRTDNRVIDPALAQDLVREVVGVRQACRQPPRQTLGCGALATIRQISLRPIDSFWLNKLLTETENLSSGLNLGFLKWSQH